MKSLYTLLAILVSISTSNGQDKQELAMQGGRVFFELTSGSQQYAPAASSDWSFRIGAGAQAIFGNVYTSGRYSIAGIRHIRGEDFPQSLVSYLRFGGGWMFQDSYARWTIAPMISAGHTSDRIMPKTGETNLQFDGWGVTPGIEGRYVVYNSFNPASRNHSSAFWGTHYLQLEIHRIFSQRAYTMAALSYNILFDGYHLAIISEYNILDLGARGWLVGLEFGFSWFSYKVK
jgi:hypothetical protein